MDNLERRRDALPAPITPERLGRILKRAFPNHCLRSFEPLKGGASNLNYLLRFNEAKEPAVLRIYTREAAACGKELTILKSASGIVPVPQIIYANPQGEEDIGPYIIYHYAEGMTFHELKQTENLQDMAEAAYAIGRVLAQVTRIAPGPVSDHAISDESLNSAVLEHRIGGAQRDRLSGFLSGWLPQLRSLNQDRALVHGDFNSRNTIIKRQGDRWVVSGILDWELAFAGCPLWDAARFICYERRARPYREPYFSQGYCDAGGSLPKNWVRVARAINTLTAADSLTRPDIPSAFIPELCDLVAAFLDDRDPT